MNQLIKTARAAAEQDFGYRMRQALNESAEALPSSTRERLAAARKAALQVQKPERKRAEQRIASATRLNQGNTATMGSSFSRGWLALVLAALLLAGAGLVSLFHVEQQRQIEETAALETGLLADELPLSTYADHGFNAFLKQNP